MKPKALLLAAVIVLMLAVPALAEPDNITISIDDGLVTEARDAISSAARPFDVQYTSLNDIPMIVKRYEMTGSVNTSIFPANIEQGGTEYKIIEILEQKQPAVIESRTAQELVTLDASSDDDAEVLSLLSPTLYHEQDGYAGQLTLDLSSIKTTVSGTTGYTYATSAQREYTGLDRADLAYIPKTVQEGTRTLTLSDVSWTPYEAVRYNNGTTPTSFTAVATYSGTASGSRANGYTVTAAYTGEITRSTPGSVIYSVIYEAVPIPEPENHWYSIFFVVFSIIVLIVAGGIVVYNKLMGRATQRIRRRYQ